MIKTLGIVGVLTIMLFSMEANAQHRHNPRNHRNVAPWILGGAALGILGAGIYYHQRTCWIEEQRVFDRWGNFIGFRNVQVCN